MKLFCFPVGLRVFFPAFILFLSAGRLPAQSSMNPDSLATDFTWLVDALEATHPDPYSSFGGRVFFHRQAFDLACELRKGDGSLTEFATKVSAFLSVLHDGHTWLSVPRPTGPTDQILPVRMRVITGGLIMDELPAEYSTWLGAKVEQINGVAVDSLLPAVSRIDPCENDYAAYSALVSDFVRHYNRLALLFPGLRPDDGVELKLSFSKKKKGTVRIPFRKGDVAAGDSMVFTPSRTGMPDEYLGFDFLDRRKRVMLFRVSAMAARENFGYVAENPGNGALEELQTFYRRMLNREMPTDPVQAVAGVPSFSEQFLHMLQAMKREQSSTLIIDLRGNSGGWTHLIYPALYMLAGDGMFASEEGTSYRRISSLWLQKRNSSLDQVNKRSGAQWRLGDYMFHENNGGNSDVADLRTNFIRWSSCTDPVKEELTRLGGEPVYRPEKIYVITDTGTFSAAFHFAFYLWRITGAVVTGVPSSQAPNTFMELTPFKLPYTGLNGSISNAVQIFLPVGDRRARTFWPDLSLTYDDYKRYGFDRHAEILYLLDRDDR